jgi:hypothetical protein
MEYQPCGGYYFSLPGYDWRKPVGHVILLVKQLHLVFGLGAKAMVGGSWMYLAAEELQVGEAMEQCPSYRLRQLQLQQMHI